MVVDGRACASYDGGGQGLPYQIAGADAGALPWAYGVDGGTYTCGVSTAGVNSAGIGAAYADAAMSLNGAACWTLASTVHPAIVDGENMWCRMIMQTGNNAGSSYMFSYGAAAGDFFALFQSSTERNQMTYRTASATALVVSSAVLSTATWYFIDWVYNAADPTNPSMRNYVNGTAAIGTEHTANLAGLVSGSRVAVGGATNGQCGLATSNIYTFISIRCAYGAEAAQFTGEAMHDADCVASGICP